MKIAAPLRAARINSARHCACVAVLRAWRNLKYQRRWRKSAGGVAMAAVKCVMAKIMSKVSIVAKCQSAQRGAIMEQSAQYHGAWWRRKRHGVMKAENEENSKSAGEAVSSWQWRS
jgi:hypothetical protein